MFRGTGGNTSLNLKFPENVEEIVKELAAMIENGKLAIMCGAGIFDDPAI